MIHEDILYISYRKYLTRVSVSGCSNREQKCTTLKEIFSMFRFLHLRLQIFNSCVSTKYCPIITNIKLIYSDN